jgi:hypothetical protein
MISANVVSTALMYRITAPLVNAYGTVFCNASETMRAVSGTDDAGLEQAARERVAATITAWINYRKIRKSVLTRDAGVSRTTLDQVLKATRAVQIGTLTNLADRLGTTVGALIDGLLPPEDASDHRRGGRLESLEKWVAQIAELQQAGLREQAAVQISLSEALESLCLAGNLPSPAVEGLTRARERLTKPEDRKAAGFS